MIGEVIWIVGLAQRCALVTRLTAGAPAGFLSLTFRLGLLSQAIAGRRFAAVVAVLVEAAPKFSDQSSQRFNLFCLVGNLLDLVGNCQK